VLESVYIYMFSLNVYYHSHTQRWEVGTQTPYTSVELLLEALLLYIAEIDKAMAFNVENSCKSIN